MDINKNGWVVYGGAVQKRCLNKAGPLLQMESDAL